MKHNLIIAFSTGLALCVSLTSLPAAEKKLSEARLQELLKTYPDADANKDGKLSEDEARQYAAKLGGKAKARGKTSPTATPTDSAQPAADLPDVKYGPHERNVLDFWFAKNTSVAAPLVIYIHGGGFVGGDKSKKLSPDTIREALDGGAAFMSINYRFREHAPIQDILRDAARAILIVMISGGTMEKIE